jgi:hypothetical protein
MGIAFWRNQFRAGGSTACVLASYDHASREHVVRNELCLYSNSQLYSQTVSNDQPKPV